MKRRLWLIAVGSATLAIVIGGVCFLENAQKRNHLLAEAVPARPDLSRFSPDFTRLVSVSEDLAQNGPDRIEGLGELSELYQANGYYPQAIACYRALVEADPRNPRWLHRWALLLASYGELPDAVTLWRQGEKMAASYLPLRIHLADALYKLNRHGEAAEEYEDVLKLDPSNGYALLGLGRIAVSEERWLDAKAFLEKTTQGNNLAIGSDLLVTVYDHLGMAAQADALRSQNKAAGAFMDIADPWVDEIYDQCFDPYRLSLLGGSADQRNHPEVGQKFLERAERYAPTDATIQFQLGQHFAQLKDYRQAEQFFQRTTELQPDFSDGWVQLAETQKQLKNQSAFLATLRTGLQHCPQSPALHLQMGQYLASQNQTAEAEKELRESIRLRPEEAQPHMELATLFFGNDRVPDGLKEIDAALKAEPDYPNALSTLAFYWISAGDESQASAALLRVAQQPRVPPATRAKLEESFQQRFPRH